MEEESEIAEVHRMFWNYEVGCGLLKVHFPPLGIVGFIYDANGCIGDFNFLNQKVIDFWCNKFRSAGHVLKPGYQIDRDVEQYLVESPEEGFYCIPEIDLAWAIYPRRVCLSTGWQDFKSSTPYVEYAPCNSVLL